MAVHIDNPAEKLKKVSSGQKKETKKFLEQVKRKPPRNLDFLFHEAHEKSFGEINCLSCANCCKTTSPIFYPKDIDRLAKELRIKPGAFIEKYLRVDEDRDFVLKNSPCPFLDSDNYCTVYDSRPTACREYPHTDRKNMYQVLDLTYKNTEVCPAVLQIVEEIKSKLNL